MKRNLILYIFKYNKEYSIKYVSRLRRFYAIHEYLSNKTLPMITLSFIDIKIMKNNKAF